MIKSNFLIRGQDKMRNCKTAQRQRILFSFAVICLLTLLLTGRLSYLMLAKADYYGAAEGARH